jgi:hypothetical protein
VWFSYNTIFDGGREPKTAQDAAGLFPLQVLYSPVPGHKVIQKNHPVEAVFLSCDVFGIECQSTMASAMCQENFSNFLPQPIL